VFGVEPLVNLGSEAGGDGSGRKVMQFLLEDDPWKGKHLRPAGERAARRVPRDHHIVDHVEVQLVEVAINRI
jgi:hypothetical protein